MLTLCLTRKKTHSTTVTEAVVTDVIKLVLSEWLEIIKLIQNYKGLIYNELRSVLSYLIVKVCNIDIIPPEAFVTTLEGTL